ncbi:MAG: hypothetical protein JSC189_000962 [Candidatus Tokpelaia sp. JSC189]|nr:MAG: hypothetical protein JSC189_000962 [Candidatus Tokpelaia sp. JSC189]
MLRHVIIRAPAQDLVSYHLIGHSVMLQAFGINGIITMFDNINNIEILEIQFPLLKAKVLFGNDTFHLNNKFGDLRYWLAAKRIDAHNHRHKAHHCESP